ncbi:MAG: hypothetical protein M1420_06485 [Actinobacteria bacterium]|nr:hypothetical protein [Actinomycetota bacterium]
MRKSEDMQARDFQGEDFQGEDMQARDFQGDPVKRLQSRFRWARRRCGRSFPR